MSKLVNVNKNGTVKQSNNLTVARYSLTLLEQRLMFAICSQIPKNADNFSKVRFSIDEIAKVCGIEGKRKYQDIRNASSHLMKRLVSIPTVDGGEYTTHWLQSRRYYPDDCSIEFKIDEDLKGELLQLKKAYVSTPVSMLTSFKKKYSSRMYLILKKMLKIGDFEYTLDFFRETFQLADTYKKFSNIKNGVLEPAIEELNKSSDLEIKHEYIKEGRFFTKIHFSVKLKDEVDNQEKVPALSVAPAPSDEAQEATEEEMAILACLAKYEITPKTGKGMLKKYGAERIDENIKFAYSHKSGKENFSGWLIDCIKKDRAADAMEAAQLAKEAEKAKQDEIFKRIEPLLKEEKCELPPDSPFKKFERKRKTEESAEGVREDDEGKKTDEEFEELTFFQLLGKNPSELPRSVEETGKGTVRFKRKKK